MVWRWARFGPGAARAVSRVREIWAAASNVSRVTNGSWVGCSLEDARTFCDGFFLAYNHEHRHSEIGMHTPASVHFGTADQIRIHRQATLDQAYAAHPERFARRPRPPRLPEVPLFDLGVITRGHDMPSSSGTV